MPDYELTRLSPRSFEQLIQSLATKVIAPGAVIFGDGPDGAREATYDGKTLYPSPQNPWDGYLVVQAKSKVRNGAKDRAFRALRSARKKAGLKGCDIWDYDKIRSLLDDSEDIRHAYAAWITPGDVLSQVAAALLPRPEFADVMATFLQKELLEDQYVNLKQAGHLTDREPPIVRVFVDLPVTKEPDSDPPHENDQTQHLPPGFASQLLQIGNQRLGDSDTLTFSKVFEYIGRRVEVLARELRESPPGHISVAFAPADQNLPTPQELPKSFLFTVTGQLSLEHGPHLPPATGRFVLVGGPGQGKTTLGQFVCQLYRSSILSQSRRRLPPEVRDTLKLVKDQCALDGIEPPGARRFPIRISLNELAAELGSDRAGKPTSVLSYIAQRVQRTADRPLSVDDLRTWLQRYPWFILLDGLDEVPASSNRDAVLKAIQEFWVEVAGADILVLATTRPQGYSEDFSPKYYQHVHLAPLSGCATGM